MSGYAGRRMPQARRAALSATFAAPTDAAATGAGGGLLTPDTGREAPVAAAQPDRGTCPTCGHTVLLVFGALAAHNERRVKAQRLGSTFSALEYSTKQRCAGSGQQPEAPDGGVAA